MHRLVEYFRYTKDDEEREKMLEAMFTPDELVMLENRFKVLELLDSEEYPHRKIKEKLEVSISTVTKGARVLKFGNGMIQILVSRRRKKKK